MKWFEKIQNTLSKAHAIYPGAELRVEASEILIDLLKETAKNHTPYTEEISTYMTMTIFGFPLIQADIKSYRVIASFVVEGEE